MNIHIYDQELFEILRRATLLEVEVGSALYGLKDAESDTDVLCIYAPSLNRCHSALSSHHSLQYKDVPNRTDYIFEDVFSFVRNCLSGDSSINFEALHTAQIKNSELVFLYHLRTCFYNYNIAKAYLGFGKRDRKFLQPSLSNREQAKKLAHIHRAYLFCKNMIEGTFELENQQLVKSYARYLEMSFNEKVSEADLLCAQIEIYRKNVLNVMLEQKKISRFMDVNSQQRIDQALHVFCESPYFKSKQLEFIDLSMYYKANEEGIYYQ